MRLSPGVILFMFMAMVSSCKYDQPEPMIVCDTTVYVTYTNFVSSVLQTNCTFFGCHDSGAPPGYDYTIYAGIKAKVDSGRFQNRVLDIKDMPSPLSPGPKSLDACTLMKLQKWVNSGAPQ